MQNCIFLDNFTNLILFLQNYSVFKVQVSLRSPCPFSYFVRKAQTTRPSLYKDYTSYNRLSPVSRPSHFCVAEIILESYAVYPIILRIIESQLEVFFFSFEKMVGQNGLEPSTSRLSVECSNQLSYWPTMVEIKGFEPLTPCLQSRCSPN